MYEGFAEVYDTLMSHIDYRSWADYYVRLLKVYGIYGGRMCECACGTGALTIPFQYAGFQMTGVDLSREMLWQAAQKTRRLGMAIPFVQQDMRALNLHRPMDAILATNDGVNYLTKEEDALSFFRCAYRALRPDGALIFDVSSPYKLKNKLCAGLICEDRDDITYVWENTWQEQTQTVEMDLVFFVKEKDGRYRRIDEHQVQRAWMPRNLEILLLQAGFTEIRFYGDRTMSQPTETGERWHVAARKPAE